MICFWSQSEYRIFSNFTPVVITIENKEYSSVEHYYQSQKFTDTTIQELIISASTGAKTKRLARKYSNLIRPDWDTIKLSVMELALRLKYSQEPFKTALKETKSEVIIEDSPNDLFWGTGLIGNLGPGLNHMGQLLMKIRSEIE